MVTTNASWAYTMHAISSFAVTTKMNSDDEFILIDNDGAASASGLFRDPPLNNFRVHRNETEKSFAENANFIIDIASKKNADVYFLNNDIIFTVGWIDALLTNNESILIPSCNQHVQYDAGTFATKQSMDLEEFLGHEKELNFIVGYHRKELNSKFKELSLAYTQYLAIPFYCVKIPVEVYSEIGLFDTDFGKGGAEDTDYCLRAYLAGFKVYLALNSYLLHFQGKSTWRGPETQFDTTVRNSDYLVAFADKWGVSLSKLLLKHDNNVIFNNQKYMGLFESRDYKTMIADMLTDEEFKIPMIKM